jgi:hypothetical protein
VSDKKKHKTRTFKKNYLAAIAGAEHGDEVTVVQKPTITGKGRWETYYTLVFSIDGECYRLEYSEGSTEQQDYGYWDYAPEEIPCTVVRPVPAIKLEYQPVIEEEDGHVSHTVTEKEAAELVEAMCFDQGLFAEMAWWKFGESENLAEKLYLGQIAYDAANNY